LKGAEFWQSFFGTARRRPTRHQRPELALKKPKIEESDAKPRILLAREELEHSSKSKCRREKLGLRGKDGVRDWPTPSAIETQKKRRRNKFRRVMKDWGSGEKGQGVENTGGDYREG